MKTLCIRYIRVVNNTKLLSSSFHFWYLDNLKKYSLWTSEFCAIVHICMMHKMISLPIPTFFHVHMVLSLYNTFFRALACYNNLLYLFGNSLILRALYFNADEMKLALQSKPKFGFNNFCC